MSEWSSALMLRPAAAALLALLLFGHDGRVGGIFVARIRAVGEGGGRFRSTSVPFESIDVPRQDVSNLPANLSLGDLLAYVPSAPVTDDLLVFLSGTGARCEDYSQFLETMGGSIRTLCVPYDNIAAIGQLCMGMPKCFPDLRLTSYNGSFDNVSGNNIELRLASALRYLHDHDSTTWADYINASSHLPLWSRMRLAGHSQGAGHAVFIAYFREVARVVQFSGVCDRSDWTKTLGPPVTPSSRFYAMASSWDAMLCPTFPVQVQHWRAEGAEQHGWWPLALGFKESLTTTDLGESHTVISSRIVPGCETRRFRLECLQMAHDSTVLNWNGTMSPYADGTWQALCGV